MNYGFFRWRTIQVVIRASLVIDISRAEGDGELLYSLWVSSRSGIGNSVLVN